MSFQKMLFEGLLKAAASLHPEYASLINFAIAHEDQLEKVGPLLSAAAKEGPGAFAAAEKAAPELADKIRDFVSSVPRTAGSHEESATVIQAHAEEVTRQIFGLPSLDPEAERKWMDDTTALQNDSRNGSA